MKINKIYFNQIYHNKSYEIKNYDKKTIKHKLQYEDFFFFIKLNFLNQHFFLIFSFQNVNALHIVNN